MTYETQLELYCKSKGWILHKEVKIIPKRRFRADYVIEMKSYGILQAHKIIIEVNGGVWSGGAHGRGTGITRDYEKSNLAQCEGFIFLQYTPQDMQKCKYIEHLEKIRNL